MRSLVLKFGGASVASFEKFAKIADIIIERKAEYPWIAVVVSAMGSTTDELLSLARKVHPEPPKRELDMLISVGERVSIALLAMALHQKGIEAISFTGSQSGIITTSEHAEARIIDVRPKRLKASLAKGKVVIVAGFQGVSEEGEITTLGRGGSDTSAVAIAIALEADQVEFYKDVGGIYNTDPKKDAQALFYPLMSYDEAIELTRLGSKILHSRSVVLAKKNHLPLRVLSFDPTLRSHCSGTWIKEKGSLRDPIEKKYEEESKKRVLL